MKESINVALIILKLKGDSSLYIENSYFCNENKRGPSADHGSTSRGQHFISLKTFFFG